MLDVVRAPALPAGIDRAAYLAAGGIEPGAVIVPQQGRAPAVLVAANAGRTSEPERPRTSAYAALWGGAHLAAIADPRVAGVGGARHPVLQITEQMNGAGLAHDVQLLVLHAMRRYYPTLDAAIKLRRVLEGDVYPECDDEVLEDELRERWETIPVGYVDGPGSVTGGNAYLDALADGADEYGLAAGEIVLGEDGRPERLVVPCPRTLSMRPTGDGVRRRYELHHSTGARSERLQGALVQTLAFRATTEGPWPEALAWTLVATTETVLRMYGSVGAAWWRFGDPSLLLGLEYDKDADPDTTSVAGVTVPSELLGFKNTVETVMQARRSGRVGDAYVATVGAKIQNQVLGDVDATLMRYFREQTSALDSLLVPLSDVPVWLFPSIQRTGDGLGGSLSQNQASIATTGAHKRNWKKRRLGKRALDAMLVADGDAALVSRYTMEATEVNILDEQLIAETRLTTANAVAAEIENAVQLFDDETGAPRFQGEALGYLEDLEVL